MSVARSVTASFARQRFSLAVAISGSGTVSSDDGGISGCGGSCSASYDSGTPVTLRASAAAGWIFNGWSGACAGTGACAVTMSAARSITATFTRQVFTLSANKTGTGRGTVASGDRAINCGSSCGSASASYSSGTTITLTATADSGSSFRGWSGGCSGTGNCVVNLTANTTVTASFADVAPPVLTVPSSITSTGGATSAKRSEEHTSELQSRLH